MDDDEISESSMREICGVLRGIDFSIVRVLNELRDTRKRGFNSTESEAATSSQAVSESELGSDEDEDPSDGTKEEGFIPEARQCGLVKYREFVKGQTRPVLDFLVAGPELDSEISIWEDRNSAVFSSDSADVKNEENRDAKTQSRLPFTTERHVTPKDSVDPGWIHSIRINSAIVIRMLRQLAADEGIAMPQDFDQKSLDFNRPFSFLIHHHAKMRIKLSELHEQLGSRKQSQETPPDLPLEPRDQETAIRQIQCYVDFVEDRLIPEAEIWTKSPELEQQQPRIRFQDLWYLFQPGDLVYVPASLRNPANYKAPSTHQSIMRVHILQQPTREYKRGGPSNLTYDPLVTYPLPPTNDKGKPQVYFTVGAYYIEFDGEAWGACSRVLRIAAFNGEQDITTLPVYPLRFKAGHGERLRQAMHDGKAMVKLIEDRFGFYSGWSLINSPFGGPIDDARGRSIKSPTHIESDVLVDFSEAFNTSPSWRPAWWGHSITTSSGITGSIGWRKSSPNVEWTDTHKTNAELRTRGRVVEWDGVDSIRASSYWHRDQYLRGSRVKLPSGEDFALIPRRFYGYSVWERKFFHLDIRSLQQRDTADSAQAFSQLQIGSDDKQLIQSLVQSHFHKKSFQAKHGIELQGQDLIRGKGKGLVILLHGVPGVGKTATAEAVAQKWQKPLFPITCGDLGITAEKVEKALKEIFRLAHLWDCVLLLDEADVFITHRVKVGDLQRNGLVSVFLRMLEYYNGILFLTTNRPGVLDEAVKSRVHLALKYDHLTLPQTEALFEFNMQRLKEIEDKKGSIDPQYRKLHLRKKEILTFAREHFEKSMAKQGVGRWNGRQIRNAFLIAASLAHYGDGEEGEAEDDELQKQLGRTHFEKVDKTTLLYDQYRREMFNRDDDSRAHEQEER